MSPSSPLRMISLSRWRSASSEFCRRCSTGSVSLPLRKSLPSVLPALASSPARSDLAGDEAKAGKTLGSDLRKGKLTLPVLHLLQTSDEAERHRLSEIILNGNDDDMNVLVERAIEAGAVKSAVATGGRCCARRACIWTVVPANQYRDALANLVTTLDAMIAQFCGWARRRWPPRPSRNCPRTNARASGSRPMARRR